ncbi:MAG: hypothetical protein JNL08_12300 [Planctomycetes bacterium]|nr:hypothetical protein [Planctomycetota bacterium]
MIAKPHVIAFSTLLLATSTLIQQSLPAQQPVTQSIGSGCGGVGGTANYASSSVPFLGSLLGLDVTHLPPQENGLFLMSLGQHATPMSLAPYGMPGCESYPLSDAFLPFTTGNGTVHWDVLIPPAQALAGATIWSQVFFQQPGLNAANVGATNGLAHTFGDPAVGSYQSSLTQWGITWQFDRPYHCGQFCNGDWWVIGPVTVTSITPGTATVSGRVINGSMVNPGIDGQHGYDSTLYAGYDNAKFKPWLNVAATMPLLIQPSSSLISTISQIGPAPNGGVSQLRTAAVLTVLGTVPPADAFRPPYSGTDKTIRHRESDLDYTTLASLAPASGAPSLTATADGFARVWLDHCANWISRYMHPVENMPDYYRSFTALTGTAGLLLNSNFTNAQKRDLLVRFVQVGIDHYGNMQNGARWGVNGHCNGRKFPILFAGKVLNDAAMLGAGTTWPTIYSGPGAVGNNKAPFSEDGQTFYVQQTSPGVYNWGYGGYTAQHVGLPEWGNFHTDNIASDDAGWPGTTGYRICCSANGWIGSALTMRIMGLQPQWNQTAYFDYVDRYMQTEPPGWTQSWTPWHATMWNTYRAQF